MSNWNNIHDATAGFYWARYKDHGWVLIGVEDGYYNGPDQPTNMAFLAKDIFYLGEDNHIPISDWGKYIDLREVKEPEFGT